MSAATDAFVQQNRDRLLDELKDFLRIPSISTLPEHRGDIDRLLALDTEELDLEQVKWVVLMVLSSQPGQELAYARMEDLVFDVPNRDPH